MNGYETFEDLSGPELTAWLRRSLEGLVRLPLVTPDESPRFGIERLARSAKRIARDNLDLAHLELVRDFCTRPEAEWDWEVIKGLLPLTELFENPETVGLLTELARHFDHYPALPQDIKFKVLCALVDTASPRQPVEFWSTIHQQNPGPAIGLALSGMLAVNQEQAVCLLRDFPNDARSGHLVVLKLNYAWKRMRDPEDQRQLLKDVRIALRSCKAEFAGPVRDWLNEKGGPLSKLSKALQPAADSGSGFQRNAVWGRCEPVLA